MRVVPRTAGDDEAYEAALVERAKQDVADVLSSLSEAALGGPPGSMRAASYGELAELGRRLAATAGFVAVREDPPHT